MTLRSAVDGWTRPPSSAGASRAQSRRSPTVSACSRAWGMCSRTGGTQDDCQPLPRTSGSSHRASHPPRDSDAPRQRPGVARARAQRGRVRGVPGPLPHGRAVTRAVEARPAVRRLPGAPLRVGRCGAGGEASRSTVRLAALAGFAVPGGPGGRHGIGRVGARERKRRAVGGVGADLRQPRVCAGRPGGPDQRALSFGQADRTMGSDPGPSDHLGNRPGPPRWPAGRSDYHRCLPPGRAGRSRTVHRRHPRRGRRERADCRGTGRDPARRPRRHRDHRPVPQGRGPRAPAARVACGRSRVRPAALPFRGDREPARVARRPGTRSCSC